MMTIKVDYTASDSERSWFEQDEIACMWSKREKVEKALQNIIEHGKYYSRFECAYHPEDQKKILNEVKSKDWYVSAKNSSGEDVWNEHAILVEKDDGELHQIDVFWCGVFESLLKAKITTAKAIKNRKI